MRCLIISDIHANLAAFEAVLQDAARRRLRFDIVWCLGDIVGYGPDPNECIDLLRSLPHVCLAGNHDWAVLGKLSSETFHEHAAFVVEWTRARLTRENLNYLRARPEQDVEGDYLLAHASPREPIWEYVLELSVAEENFDYMPTAYALIGHTHVPAIFVKNSVTLAVYAAAPTPSIPIALKPNHNYIINPGSVGQPRDGDPRAAYALLDTEKSTWTPHRVEYPIKRTQEKMRAAGFPDRLIERLSHGR
ncbi:MAG: metallophosphoesterase [Chloroflexi bacterium]|jgi:diadenosine tetraphosphatase ApaH/serine/threonine PP2A family protein phosphatase|uniref:Metallophosphoesterase n=1 Tax=Candidatus Thermofonsia Clade 3 bacterium TaxID=2364212 RepID=A0A2M8QG90_9CHLR|nr:metallophosphoesterase family protein [Candidatus Roseilinea sp. NK_OTU-006]PJF48788.1 MAG: metallophosphoesterase [Candidatus Thermofonsia Clade 3 bacterium]RMG63619.1 MAG: metallophosphoesterase [Chloroflexota bacterium]